MAGDDGFDEFVAVRYAELLRVAYLLTGSRPEAEDLVQTALIRVLRRWSRVDDPMPYVRRAMVNQHHSWYRQSWRRLERPVDRPPERAVVDEAIERVDPALRSALWELVLQLPPRQRACVVLRHYEGLGEQQTAEALGLGVGHVKSATSRGLAALRARLALADLAAPA